MKNLKIILYEKTAAALETYQRSKAQEPDADWEIDRRTFCALYEVIGESGLEDEYKEWKYGKKLSQPCFH